MTRKQVGLLLAGLLLLGSLWLLAGSLEGLTFQPGRLPAPFSAVAPGPVSGGPSSSAPAWTRWAFLFTVWVLLPASLVMVLFDPKSLKLVLQRALVLSGWALIAIALLRVLPRLGLFQLGAGATANGSADPTSGGLAFPDAGALVLPWWGRWLASSLALAGGLWLAWRARRSWLQRHREPDWEAELGREASTAARELRAGAPTREVILHCYQRMCEVLAGPQVQRMAPLTPREFEARLRREGLFHDAIAQLSRLFERARYGARPASAAEERRALACLEDIERRFRRTS